MTNDDLTRRDFLRVGAGAFGASLGRPGGLRAADKRDAACILLFLVGGPSQLDTWDPKPDAPSEVRGPFRPIKTNVPGVEIGEHFPLMAHIADRYAILRSVHHKAALIHETGCQLMQTGRLGRDGVERPHYGAVLSYLYGREGGAPPFVVLPAPIGDTGVRVGHGQTAGHLGPRHEPLVMGSGDDLLAAETDDLRSRYGRNAFGRSCLLARRLVERGVRMVTVNMFEMVFGQVTWDCHADGGSLSTSLNDYKETLCPMFDRAYTALLEDLGRRGLLDTTLVAATGEFGRTPRLNRRGGRDHWPGVWSALLAGAGVRGGQVVGASDKLGAEPKERPVTAAEVAATVYRGLGVDLTASLPGPDGRPTPLVEAAPVEELF